MLPWNGETKAWITFYFRPNDKETSDYLDRAKNFLKTESVSGFKGKLPSKLGTMPRDFNRVAYRVYLVRNKTCETADFGKPDSELQADPLPLENDPNANWDVNWQFEEMYLTRSFKLNAIYSNGNIASIEDFKGTTILLHSRFPETDIYVASSIDLSFAQGTTLSTHFAPAGTSSFCSTFSAAGQ
jgi:hypothetical protein